MSIFGIDKDAGEKRWDAATRRADGATYAIVTRSRRIYLTVAALVVATALAVAITALVVRGDADIPVFTDPRHPILATIALVAVIAGAVSALGGFAWAFLVGDVREVNDQIARSLSLAQRWSASRQIAGRGRLDDNHLEALVGLAKQQQRIALAMAPGFGVIGMGWAAIALSVDEAVPLIAVPFATALIVGMELFLFYRYRQAERFLERQS